MQPDDMFVLDAAGEVLQVRLGILIHLGILIPWYIGTLVY